MDTKKLLEELKNCDDFKKFYKTHRDSVERKNLSDYLAELIEKKVLKSPKPLKLRN